MCYYTTLFGSIVELDKIKMKQINPSPLFSVTFQLPDMNIPDLTRNVPRNPQHGIKQRALSPVIQKTALHSVKWWMQCCSWMMNFTPFVGSEQSSTLLTASPGQSSGVYSCGSHLMIYIIPRLPSKVHPINERKNSKQWKLHSVHSMVTCKLYLLL